MKLGMLIMAVGVAIFWIFPNWLMGLFSASGEMLDMGVTAMRVISTSWIPGAFVIVSCALFQALAHAVFALVISVVRQLGVILPVAWLLTHYYGVNAAWYAYPIAEVSAFTLALIFYQVVRKRDIRNLPDGAPVNQIP
jgi:Na+-driven multidrug efflux pump